MQSNVSSLASDPIGGLQAAYDQITASAVIFGKIAGPVAKAYSSAEAAAAGALSAASGVLFMTTAGVIAAATLSIGVLTAVGPLFIAMFLMPATRGLFAGWVRALVAAALVLMLGWLGITLRLSVLEPWLVTLAREQQEHKVVAQTATSTAALVFVFGAGQVALLIGACVMAFGFRLPGSAAAAGVGRRVAPSAPVAATPAESTSRAQRLAFDLQREPSVVTSHSRSMHVAAGASPSARRDSPANQPSRLGDDYRRPGAATRRLRVR
jgi:type IV secretion system protein VirB6